MTKDGLARHQDVPSPDEDVGVLKGVSVVPGCEVAHGDRLRGVVPRRDLHVTAVREPVPVAEVNLAAAEHRHVVAAKDSDALPQLALHRLDLVRIFAVHDGPAKEARPCAHDWEAHALVEHQRLVVAALVRARVVVLLVVLGRHLRLDEQLRDAAHGGRFRRTAAARGHDREQRRADEESHGGRGHVAELAAVAAARAPFDAVITPSVATADLGLQVAARLGPELQRQRLTVGRH
mmetsp:Transcript_9719/g.29933  ORF Transcript_9719/g.29933 Transcript_9719/m.29933 type:complete len:235 (-) Transcript_9719:41-745(-)